MDIESARSHFLNGFQMSYWNKLGELDRTSIATYYRPHSTMTYDGKVVVGAEMIGRKMQVRT